MFDGEDMMDNERSAAGTGNASILGCLIPTFWMLGGNGILAICAVAIAAGERATSNAADLCYWLTVGCLLAARYADIRYLGGRTSEGAPASMAHWRRYAVVLVVVSIVLWIVAHSVPDLGL